MAVPGYRSGAEGRFGEALKIQAGALGIGCEYEPERIAYVVECNYLPDFVLTLPSGRKVYIEYKGYLDDDDRRKMALVRRQRPDIDLRIVFETLAEPNRPTRKGAKQTVAGWCRKHGIPWATREVPPDWLKA